MVFLWFRPSNFHRPGDFAQCHRAARHLGQPRAHDVGPGHRRATLQGGWQVETRGWLVVWNMNFIFICYAYIYICIYIYIYIYS